MSLSDVLRLLARKWPLLVLVPVILGVSTYFFARHLPKTYSSDTTIYTGIASGYSLAGTAQTDYNSTSNAFDNLINLIKARSTKEEVIYQLLATHLWQTNQQPALVGTGAYTSLQEIPVELRRELTGATQLATLENVRRYARANTSNAIYQLLNSSNPTYSLAALNSLTAARIGTSDLIRLEFETYDPELCQYTLALATQVFLNQSRSLRGVNPGQGPPN
jgi:succinoglycan biosynthesis transport protein ExoP